MQLLGSSTFLILFIYVGEHHMIKQWWFNLLYINSNNCMAICASDNIGYDPRMNLFTERNITIHSFILYFASHFL